jgi:hypothetical protein
VALLAVGGAFAGLTANIANDINHPAQGASYDKSLEDRGRTYQSASIATFALGGALAVTGVVLIGVSRRRPAKLALGPGPGDAGLLLSGSFQ